MPAIIDKSKPRDFATGLPNIFAEPGSLDSTEHGQVESVWEPQRILNLEGESYAGLCALFILRELIRYVRKWEQDITPQASSSASSPLFATATTTRRPPPSASPAEYTSPFRPCHYFDYICGTSLGGTCAVMLGSTRFTIEETIERSKGILYALELRIVGISVSFSGGTRKARNSGLLLKHLQASLEDQSAVCEDETTQQPDSCSLDHSIPSQFGRATMSIDRNMCQTIVFTTQKAKRGIQRPFIIRSYVSEARSYSAETGSFRIRNPQEDTTGIALVDACRASLAEPSSFDGVKLGELGVFRDATVSMINPALEAYNEVRETRDANIECLISFGRSTPSNISGQSVDSLRQRQDEDDELVTRIPGLRHFKRFVEQSSPAYGGGSPADNIDAAERRAFRYCEQKTTKEELDLWARRLVEYRRRRAETARWQTYAGLAMPCATCGDHTMWTRHMRNVTSSNI